MAYYGNSPADVALVVGQDVITTTEIQDATIATADIASDAITATKVDDDGTGFQMGSLGLGTAVSGSNKLTVSGASLLEGELEIKNGASRRISLNYEDSVNSIISHSGTSYGLEELNVRGDAIRFYTDYDSGTPKGNVTLTLDNSHNATFAGSVASTSLTTTGNIGVGSATTSSPSSASRTLRIQHASGSASLVLCGDNDNETAWDILANTSGQLDMRKNNSSKLLVEADGTVVMSGALQPAGNVSIGGYAKTSNYFETAGGSGGQQAFSSSVTSSYRGGGLIRFFTDNNVSIFKLGNEDSPYGGYFGTFAGYSPTGAELMILGIDGVNIGKNRNSEVIGLRCSTGGTLQSGAGAINATNADNWNLVVKSTTGGTIASGGGMGYFALGDNYTTSDAILQVRNDGNRGGHAHASGSSLFKASFNDGDAFTIDKSGNVVMGGSTGGSLFLNSAQGAKGGIYWGGVYGQATTKLVNIDNHAFQDVVQISFNNSSWGTVMFELKFADSSSRAGVFTVSTQGYSGITSLQTVTVHDELANSTFSDNFQLAYMHTGNIKLQAKNYNSVDGMGLLVTVIGGNQSSDNDIGATWLR
tara:strand:+ start:390 stop:2153 length:1764 start_codon:yes stop_codon:yes gene_type:complete